MKSNTSKLIESQYTIPCGPMQITADGVCRQPLPSSLDTLLDKLTEKIHPVSQSDKIPKGLTLESSEGVLKEEAQETPEERRARLLEEGKTKAEVKVALKAYEQQLLERDKEKE